LLRASKKQKEQTLNLPDCMLVLCSDLSAPFKLSSVCIDGHTWPGT
jgi:hypothetical protein